MVTEGKTVCWSRAGARRCWGRGPGVPDPDPELQLIRMDGPPPPDNLHVCIDNGDGTGSWGPVRWFRLRLFSSILTRHVEEIVQWPKVVLRRLTLPLLVGWVNLGGWGECFLKKNSLVAFVLPGSYRKCISYVLLSVLFVVPENTSSVIAGVGLSIVAAAIYDFVVNIIPDEFGKLRHARRVSEIVGVMSTLKAYFLIRIGYIEDNEFGDDVLYIDSANRGVVDAAYVNFFDNEFLNCKTNFPFDVYDGFYDLVEFTNRILKEYDDCLNELMEYRYIWLFPSMYNIMLDIKFLRKKGELPFKFSHNEFAGNVQSELRKSKVLDVLFSVVYLVDVLEYSCERFVFPYSKVRFGYVGGRTKFSKRFVGHQHNRFRKDVFISVVEAQSGM